MLVGLTLGLELCLNLLGKALTKLNTPLVEGVDTPDSTLSEGKVLVVDDQSTKSTWSDLLSENRGSWSVTKEGLVWNKVVWSALSLKLIWSLTNHKSLSLGEVVGCKHNLVPVVLGWVVGLGSENEVSWDELGTLVEQLVEGVLGVGGWLSEKDWSSGVVDHLSLTVDGLTVRLHRQLLEVGWEAVEVLVKSTTR